METRILKLWIFILLASSLTICCNSCNDKKEVPTDTMPTPEVNPDGTEGSGAPEIDNANMTDEPPAGSAGSATNGNGSKKSGTTTGNGKTAVKKGYSAPDGTDAENHDGDMYTKNDTMPRPTGTPIK